MITEYKIAIGGLVAVVLLETVALMNGIDGIALSSSMAVIGSVVGYVFKSSRLRRGKKK